MTPRLFAPVAGAVLLAFASCASPGATPEASPPLPQAAVGTEAAGAIPGPSPRAGATASEIHADDLRLRIGLLAHDSMRGRETGSREKEMAGDYLAREAERLGLTPGGDDGTYFQAVPLERRHRTMEVASAGAGSNGGLTAEDIVLVSGLGGLPSTSREAVEGDLVFGGYLFDPEIAPGELRPDQLLGANVIVRMDGAPGVGDPPTIPPRMELAMLFGPQSPAAAVLIVAEGDLEDFWDYARDVSMKGEVALRGGEPPMDVPPFFLITPEAVEHLVGVPIDEARRPQTGLGTLRTTFESRVEPYDGRNVVAIVPGADPERTHEYMTLGAHYDHVGVGTPVDGDSIYNGADDNASGTSAILEVAEYLAHLPEGERPARSVLFIWHAAEESGLLGSEYFTDHPTVPRDAMIAHINMDMVGRNHPDSLFLVGSGRLSTEYAGWVEEANAALPEPFVLDYQYDEPGHPEMLYCRSDHWNFARYGIPVVKIGSGLHDDYHLPSDTSDKIEYEKVARVAQFAAEITRRVADAPAPPRVDRAPPPFGAPCEG
jgi:hypothetical protein